MCVEIHHGHASHSPDGGENQQTTKRQIASRMYAHSRDNSQTRVEYCSVLYYTILPTDRKRIQQTRNKQQAEVAGNAGSPCSQKYKAFSRKRSRRAMISAEDPTLSTLARLPSSPSDWIPNRFSEQAPDRLPNWFDTHVENTKYKHR